MDWARLSTLGDDAGAPSAARRRLKPLALGAALALAGHALLLGRFTAPEFGAAPVGGTVVQVRTLPWVALPNQPAPPAGALAAQGPAAPGGRDAPSGRSFPRHREAGAWPTVDALRRGQGNPNSPASGGAGPQVAMATRPEVALASRTEVAPAIALSAVAAVAEPEAVSVPTYPTRLPPAMTLHYALQRGLQRGSAELAWQPDGEQYALTLDARLAGAALLKQVSQGTFDAAGIAPRRFTDQRGRRAPQAANFQREAGKITYSGPAVEHPLPAGAQDRLTWMVQLAAVVARDPAGIASQGHVVLAVAGTRGDLVAWDFRLVDTPLLATPLGEFETLHFVREPRGRYDTRAEVWLAAAHHHLPVRALWRGNADSEALELQLQGAPSLP